jgi:hypothetical protein
MEHYIPLDNDSLESIHNVSDVELNQCIETVLVSVATTEGLVSSYKYFEERSSGHSTHSRLSNRKIQI